MAMLRHGYLPFTIAPRKTSRMMRICRIVVITRINAASIGEHEGGIYCPSSVRRLHARKKNNEIISLLHTSCFSRPRFTNILHNNASPLIPPPPLHALLPGNTKPPYAKT